MSDEIERVTRELDEIRYLLSLERSKKQYIEGIFYSPKSNLDVMQGLIGSVNKVMRNIDDDDAHLSIQIKRKPAKNPSVDEYFTSAKKHKQDM